MFTLRLLFRKAGPLGKVLMSALFLLAFIFTVIRVYKATHATHERNNSVHTRRSPR